MKAEIQTKESLKCMKCKKEFELVANMNKHINDMRITQPFWTKWKHIGNIDTEKRT